MNLASYCHMGDVDYSQLRVSNGLSPNSHDLGCPALKLWFVQFNMSAPTP